MDKKAFGIGFLSGMMLLVAVGIIHHTSAPVKASPPPDPRQWCESENAGYEGALPTRIVRNNTWAIMTANIYMTHTAQRDLSSLSEEAAQDMACRILYNVYHPRDRRD